MIGCVLNPVGCASAWVNSIPTETVYAAIFVAGLVIGAWAGKTVVGLILAVWAAVSLLGKRQSADDFHEHVGGKDASPPVKSRVRRDSIAKRLGIGE